MRQAVLKELGRIDVVNSPEPQIGSELDVKVKVMAVGICGTDLHMFHETRSDVTLPVVMGHELSGLVTEVGSAVTRVRVGDHVALDPVFACGKCPTCLKGYPNVCSSVRCFGVQMDGGYQDYIVVSEDHLYPYSPDISYEEAALAEPFSIASNILSRVDLKEGESVLVIGSGTIGLSVLQVAKSIGARVTMADFVEEKLKLALAMGADEVYSTGSAPLPPDALFDVVIDAAGTIPIFEEAIDHVLPRARIACIGFSDQPARIAPGKITRKEVSIIGSRMNCRRFPIVMEWLEDGRIDADRMITKRYGIEDIQQAFEDTLKDSAGSIKTVITFE